MVTPLCPTSDSDRELCLGLFHEASTLNRQGTRKEAEPTSEWEDENRSPAFHVPMIGSTQVQLLFQSKRGFSQVEVASYL